MYDEEEIVFELDDDLLPHTAQSCDSPALGGVNRGVHRAEQEWLRNAHVLEPLTGYPRCEGVDIDSYVRQLWHLVLVTACRSSLPADTQGSRFHP